MDLSGFVLAAGLGTRISALSRLRPKPLFPLGRGTPLSRAVAALRRAGVARVVANASHLAAQVVDVGSTLGVEVVVEVDGPLGTAGGLHAACDRLAGDAVAIWNGDIVADLEVSGLASALDRDRTALASLAVWGELPPGQGNVGLDDEGRVVRLRDRSFAPEARGAWFAAVHVLRRELARRAPARGCLIGDVYLPALAEGARVVAVPSEARWHDIGDVGGYLAACVDLLGGAATLAEEGASVASEVALDRAVVCAGATVEGEGALREVVVWPGARAMAPLSRAVVAREDLVVRG